MKDIDLGKRGDDFWCYALGLCAASVCSSHSPERVALEMNKRVNLGLASLNVSRHPMPRWTVSSDATFRSGDPHPNPCEDQPETHKHYLLES